MVLVIAKKGDGARRSGPRAERSRGDNMWLGLLRNRKAQIGLLFLLFFLVLAVFPGLIAPYSPSAESFLPNLSPSAAHWLGTTSFGQDIFSQLVWGARQSLIIAFAAGFIATLRCGHRRSGVRLPRWRDRRHPLDANGHPARHSHLSRSSSSSPPTCVAPVCSTSSSSSAH